MNSQAIKQEVEKVYNVKIDTIQLSAKEAGEKYSFEVYFNITEANGEDKVIFAGVLQKDYFQSQLSHKFSVDISNQLEEAFKIKWKESLYDNFDSVVAKVNHVVRKINSELFS